MVAPIRLRDDFDAARLRGSARALRDPDQLRRLLSLAEIHDGGSRANSARIGGIGLQAVRDWVLRFSYVGLEARVPAKHSLRVIRAIVNDVLGRLSCEFEALYSHTGRPSIPPEQLLRALLLQASYSVRSERQLMEQLEFKMLFRWFFGLGLDDSVWDASTFCHNRPSQRRTMIRNDASET